MNHFKDCPIDKDIVILASGESRKNFPMEKRDKYFVIVLNFVEFDKPDMRIWSDKSVTDYLDDQEKDCLWVTRPDAFHPKNTYNILDKVDYWFEDRKEGFEQTVYIDGQPERCKWTLYWLLHLLRKHFQKKFIYIFGMDCHNNIMTSFVKGEIVKKKADKNNCESMPEAFRARKDKEPDFFYGVYNMNLSSAVTCLEYKDIKDL